MANKRKRNNTQATAVKKQTVAAGIPSPPSDATTPFEPNNASSIVLPEDMEMTVETLQTLAQYPSVIKSKACKDLRTAVYAFRQACTTGLNAASGEHCVAVSLVSILVLIHAQRAIISQPAFRALLPMASIPML